MITRKLLILLLVRIPLVSLGAGTVFLVAYLHFKDGSPPEDGHLVLQPCPPRESLTLYSQLQHLSVNLQNWQVPVPEGFKRKGGNSQSPSERLASLAKGHYWNEEMVVFFLHILEGYANSVDDILKDSELRYDGDYREPEPFSLSHLRVRSQLYAVEARLSLRQGDWNRYYAALESNARLGRQLLESRGDYQHYMLGLEVLDYPLECVVEQIGMGLVDFNAKMRLKQAIDVSFLNDALKMTLRAEYTILKNKIQNGWVGNLTVTGVRLWKAQGLLFEENNTLSIFANSVDTIIGQIGQNDFSRTGCESWADDRKMTFRQASDFLAINSVGKWMFSNAYIVFEEIFHGTAKMIAKARLIEAGVATRLHQIETGKLPRTLTDLVPLYLDSIPKDPFAGDRGLNYDPSRRVIWSVGRDLRNRGGIDAIKRFGVSGPDLERELDREPTLHFAQAMVAARKEDGQ